MRLVPLLAAAIIFTSGAAYAQNAPVIAAQPVKPDAAKPTNEKPVDNGPTTPQSNAAYQGGGVVLQGAPGAPAPTPQPTAPGQTPQQAVPK